MVESQIFFVVFDHFSAHPCAFLGPNHRASCFGSSYCHILRYNSAPKPTGRPKIGFYKSRASATGRFVPKFPNFWLWNSWDDPARRRFGSATPAERSTHHFCQKLGKKIGDFQIFFGQKNLKNRLENTTFNAVVTLA